MFKPITVLTCHSLLGDIKLMVAKTYIILSVLKWVVFSMQYKFAYESTVLKLYIGTYIISYYTQRKLITITVQHGLRDTLRIQVMHGLIPPVLLGK